MHGWFLKVKQLPLNPINNSALNGHCKIFLIQSHYADPIAIGSA